MFLQYTPFPDNMMLHFTCGMLAGLNATLVGSPLDVIKTRLMNKDIPYNGFFDCATKTLKREGFLAFYNGFTANFMRIGTWNIIMWISFEKIHKFLFK